MAPIVNRLYNAIKEDPALSKDVKMIGVALADESKQVAIYKKKFRVSFPAVFDTDYEVFQALGVPSTPYVIVTNKQGKVLMSHGGMIKHFDQMLKEIKQIDKQ
ncbi:MAG: TlpA disulfide reductase family protein [Deltaproteobacteria bacterium]|jgi:peroxiredoxin